MENIARELLRLKEVIEKASVEKARIEGQLLYLGKELKEKFGCETLEDAKKRHSSMLKRIESMRKMLKEKVEWLTVAEKRL